MNNVKDYFAHDFPTTLTLNKTFDLREPNHLDKIYCQFIARLHLEKSSNSLFISYYIPKHVRLIDMINILLNPDTVLSFQKNLSVSVGYLNEIPFSMEKMHYARLIYIYIDEYLTTEEKQEFLKVAEEKDLTVIIRDKFYSTKKNELAIPIAFVSHDSHDKSELVRPICERLRRRLCIVWYDEYSLKIGDSLRESIEDGIKKCKKCIVVISPHFISNSGWSKKEFNSIFQREIIQGQNIILPIWHNVTKEKVYDYCPSLANIFALNSAEGIEVVADKLFQKLMVS